MQKTYVSTDNIAIMIRDARCAYQGMLDILVGGVDEMMAVAPPTCADYKDLKTIRERLISMRGE